jgi:hypothetical protein
MSKNKTWFLIIGFLLFLYGFLALILQFIGIQFTFMAWVDAAGNLVGFVVRLLMILAGIVMAAWGSIDLEQEEL